jgi:small-conductance mechanosensitive channel
MSFVFSSSVGDAFSAFVFVVFVNAYNVGDLIEFEGDFAYVREINLLTTRLDTLDGRRAVAANVYMASMPVFNYTRSTDYAFGFNVHINIDTPTENIKEFIRRMESYADLRPKTWNDLWTNVSSLEHSQSLVLEVWCTLANVNWALWLFSTPQTQFMLFIQKQLRDLGILGYLAPQPVLVTKTRSSKKRAPVTFTSSKKAQRFYSPPPVSRKPRQTDPLARHQSGEFEDHEHIPPNESEKAARSLPGTPRRLREKSD